MQQRIQNAVNDIFLWKQIHPRNFCNFLSRELELSSETDTPPKKREKAKSMNNALENSEGACFSIFV